MPHRAAGLLRGICTLLLTQDAGSPGTPVPTLSEGRRLCALPQLPLSCWRLWLEDRSTGVRHDLGLVKVPREGTYTENTNSQSMVSAAKVTFLLPIPGGLEDKDVPDSSRVLEAPGPAKGGLAKAPATRSQLQAGGLQP